MKDALAAAADLASFIGIILIITLVLWGLSAWARRHRRYWHNWLLHRNLPEYPIITRSDLDVEAANAECGIVPLSEYIRHRNKFEGRHDAA